MKSSMKLLKPKSRKPHSTQVDTYYRPGLFSDEQIITPLASGTGDGSDALFKKSPGYWVNSSSEQTVDKFGEPAGFQY